MKRRALISFVLISLMPVQIALADSANPPQIGRVKIADAKSFYTPGDEIVFEIGYSGGNPGIKSVMLYPKAEDSSNQNCIGSGVGLSWVLGEQYSSSYVGPVSTNVIRLTGTITSNCANNGVVKFESTSMITLVDRTDLSDFEYVDLPSITVKDGKNIPPGTLLAEPKTTSLNLDFIQDSYVIDESNPTLIQLPKKNSDGLVISYRARSWIGPQACRLMIDSSGYGSTLVLMRSGECNVEAGIGLTRSEFTKAYALKNFLVSTKVEAEAKAAAELKRKLDGEARVAAELKAKQEAEAKAAAELKAKQEAEAKAAAELKAKQDAEARTAADKLAAEKVAAAKLASKKKTTITCVKGKHTKKVTAIKPKCPTGYKSKK